MRLLKIAVLLMGVAGDVLFLYFGFEITVYSVLAAVGFLAACLLFQHVVHELGHLVGGKMDGYRLLLLTMGPLNFFSDGKKLSFSLKKIGGGQCIMVPPNGENVKYRAYNAGGIVASLALMLLCHLFLLIDSGYAVLFCIQSLTAGTAKILINLIPERKKGVPNDGYILRFLRIYPAARRDYAAYLRLYAALTRGEDVDVGAYTYPREGTEEELLYYREIGELLKETGPTV